MNPVGTPTSLVAYCKTCGYDLRASVERCPECGRAFDPADAKTYARRPPRGWLWRWGRRALVLLLGLGLLLGGIWGWLYWGWKREQNAVAKLGTRVPPYVVPLGGMQLQRDMGPTGWVLERARDVSLPSVTTDADMVHLHDLQGVEHLWMECTKVTDAGLVHLKELKGLQVLSLAGTPITDAGLVHLKELKGLQMLSLAFTPVTDAGLVHLKELKGLQNLGLSGTKVTDAGLVHLKELKGLKELRLYGTPVSDAGVKELQAALPECKIYGP